MTTFLALAPGNIKHGFNIFQCKRCNEDTNTVVGAMVSYDGAKTLAGWWVG